MNKKKLILFVAITIVVVITIILGFFKIISIDKSSRLIIDLPVPSQTINKSATFNENGYFTYIIEGVINNIHSTDPLKIDVAIRTEKILPEYTEPVIKTITLGRDAQVIIRNLATNEESTISAFTSLKIDDDLVAWLEEPNTKLLELDNFTATKIIINR